MIRHTALIRTLEYTTLKAHTRKRLATYLIFLLLFLFSLHNAYSENTDINNMLLKILPSIMVIDTEKITYKVPYETPDISNLLFPFFLEKSNNNVQGNGVEQTNLFGSGVLIKKSGSLKYVLTNYHVVENSNTVWLTSYDGIIHKATLVGYDAPKDIAVLSFESDTDYPLLAKSSYKEIYVGMDVYAIGSPYGFTFSVSKGIISSLNRTDVSLKNIFIQTDASMNPGNSGGALINEKGELIGISTWIYSPKSSASSIGLNFASSVDIALDAVEKILEEKAVQASWVGLIYDSFSPAFLNDMDIPYRFGSMVTNIVLYSPASNSDLLIGDIITKINDYTVQAFNSNLNNTSALISLLTADEPSIIKVLRNKQSYEIKITPKTIPDITDRTILAQITHNIWPGMTALPISYYRRELLGLDEKNYILSVDDVIPNTSADMAHIEEDDIILKINGKNIDSYQEFLNVINLNVTNPNVTKPNITNIAKENNKNNKNIENSTKGIVFTIFKNGNLIEKTLKFPPSNTAP